MIELMPSRSYDSALFVMVDASGHSNIVLNNAKDKASAAFNLLEKRILERFESTARSCAYSERWGWQGDGGLLVLWDDNESIAIRAAVEFSCRLLSIDLPSLQKDFAADDVCGELHLRIAVHKGTLNYTDNSRRGSIHSTAINHVAHLEKSTPADCIALTEDIYRILGASEKSLFHQVGVFEDHRIFLHSPELTSQQLERSWYSLHGLDGSKIQTSIHRPSEYDKASLLKTAGTEVIDIGSALRTCSGYLTSTRRPAIYRDTVLTLLRQGVKYKCYLLNPDLESTRICGNRLYEDLPQKICNSLSDFKRFKGAHRDLAENLELFFYEHDIGQAILGVDAHGGDGLLLFSPILPAPPTGDLERADMPHYLASRSSAQMYNFLMQYVCNVQSQAVRVPLDNY